MWRMRLSSTRSADVLDAHADHARQALACAYSTSDEYEAAVIAARRQAGAYGRDPRQTLAAFAVATMLVVAAALIMPL
jgi:predicted RNase H-like nuclease (RuvC/YqgF family)